MPRKFLRGEKLVIATHNPGKLREISTLLAPHGVETISAGDLGLPEPEETAPGFTGNARLKALAATTATNLPALADDSGFSLAALHGAPGIHSARWAGPEKNFSTAMTRANTELGPTPDRRAWFTAALCLAWPDSHTETFLARIEGTAIWPPRGTQGFGYDPMFLPANATQTFGEMDPNKKEAISHRARAFAQLLASCFE